MTVGRIGLDHHAFFIQIPAERQIDFGFCPCHEGLIGNTVHVLRNNGSHASCKEHAGQGDDKGLDIHIGDQESLYEPEDNTGNQDNNHGRNRSDAALFHHPCEHHTAHGDKGTDTDINTACNHYNGHSDTDYDQARIGNEEI